MKRLAAGSALAVGALGVLFLTLRDGPQVKPVGAGVGCVVVAAYCQQDGGGVYRVATIAANPADAGMPPQDAVAAFDALLATKDCERAGHGWQDTDGGLCAAQPNAMRVWNIGAQAWPCRCQMDDGGYNRIPCTLLDGTGTPRELFGCRAPPPGNVEDAP